MAIVKPKVDAVIVGMGWTGAIMAKELTDAGLRVVALERGPDRDTQPDFAYPRVVDELEGSIHRKFLQSLAKETITARHTSKATAPATTMTPTSAVQPAAGAPKPMRNWGGT